jgi:hypothetical protein
VATFQKRIGSEGSRYASFSVSDTGVLVTARGLTRPVTRLTWVDRAGRPLGTIGEPATYQSLALSSDERRVAVAFASGTPENLDIWILDVASGAPTRLTFDPGLDNSPLWSPDGSRIVFQASGEGFRHYVRNGSTARATSPCSRLRARPSLGLVGRRPIRDLRTPRPGTAASRSLGSAFGDRKPFPIIQTPRG